MDGSEEKEDELSTLLLPLLVGVDGSSAADGAVRAAVAEARQLGASVRLVHVVPDHFALVPVDALVGRDLDSRGAGLLVRAAAEVAAMAPDVEVETELRRGGVASQLAEACEHAAALYVGRDSSVLKGVVKGNAAVGVATRAPCPVVVVPADWQPREDGGEVVVALKMAAGAAELFADAFAEAETHGARLVVLHSWRLPDMYDDIILSRVDPTEPARRTAAALELLLHEWRTSYPDVEVELRIVHEEPVHALVEASRSADLLVLVRRVHGLKRGTLGGTGRAVLRGAECPVRVISPEGLTAVPGLVLEQAGDLVK